LLCLFSKPIKLTVEVLLALGLAGLFSASLSVLPLTLILLFAREVLPDEPEGVVARAWLAAVEALAVLILLDRVWEGFDV